MTSTSSDSDGTVFVISQIGDPASTARKRADVVCDYLITPVARELGLTVVRSDRDVTPGHVTSQILRNILDAHAVVADLTGRNPNVFYELAVAQSFGRPVVLLVNDAQQLPFDTRNDRTIVIGDSDGPISFEAGIQAQGLLRSALALVLKPGYIPSSLITEVAGASSLADLAPSDPLATQLGTVVEGVEEMRQALRRLSLHSPRQSEVQRLMTFIEYLVGLDRILRHELRALVLDNASDSFTNWIGTLEAAAQDSEAKLSTRSFDPDDFPY